MRTITLSVTVNRPVEAVWGYISNFENTTQWSRGVLEARQTSMSGCTPLAVPSNLVRNICVRRARRSNTYRPKRFVVSRSTTPSPIFTSLITLCLLQERSSEDRRPRIVISVPCWTLPEGRRWMNRDVGSMKAANALPSTARSATRARADARRIVLRLMLHPIPETVSTD